MDVFCINETNTEEVMRALEWESLSVNNDIEDELMTDLFEETVPTAILASPEKNDLKTEANNTESTKIEKSSSLVKDGDRDLPKAKGNSAKLASMINPEFDEKNIIKSGRTRNQAKLGGMAAHQYYLSFSAATKNLKKSGIEWTRENLPPAPKGWNQMLRHQFAVEFKRAAEKEYSALE